MTRYRYLPAWADYEMVTKDNPSDYMHAFRQMVYAMRYLRGDVPSFEKDTYDSPSVDPWEDEIRRILETRQLDSCADWKALGEKMSGQTIDDFDENRYFAEYIDAAAGEKDDTYLGRFFIAAMAQKSMVTGKIFESGSLLAGISIDFTSRGFKGIRDFRKLVEQAEAGLPDAGGRKAEAGSKAAEQGGGGAAEQAGKEVRR